jgi:mRNA interferase YafQ
MRTIERSSRFKRDYKRVVASGDGQSIGLDLAAVLTALASDLTLPARNHDHALIGDWKGFRDCRVRPDLVLIYRKVGSDLLELARLGSHSDLF